METTLLDRLTTIIATGTTPLRSTTPRAVVIAGLVNKIEKLEAALRILAQEVERLQRVSEQAPSPLDPSISRRFRRGADRRAVPPA